MDSYALAFSRSNLGPKSYQKALSKFATPEKAWNGSEKDYAELGIVLKTFKTFNTF